jgi:phospholipid/cholesterol/gamma-HCH transport system ATP-binding protein
MIEIQNISKRFGDKVVIDDISAQFKPGICNLIIGTSGSGKTVLVKCIVDLLKADKGEILFDKMLLSKMDKDERKDLRQNLGMPYLIP